MSTAEIDVAEQGVGIAGGGPPDTGQTRRAALVRAEVGGPDMSGLSGEHRGTTRSGRDRNRCRWRPTSVPMNAFALEAQLDRELLELAHADDLPRVLAILVSLTGARFAYVEASGVCATSDRDLDAAALRATLPPQLLRRARLGAHVTGCASANDGHLEAVLCSAIAPVGGALYLQGRGPFHIAAHAHALRVARRIGERALLGVVEHQPLELHAATREFQRRHVLAALDRNHWSVTEAARELKVARSYVYKLIALHELRRDVH